MGGLKTASCTSKKRNCYLQMPISFTPVGVTASFHHAQPVGRQAKRDFGLGTEKLLTYTAVAKTKEF
jgi:hypothetical protein